MHKVSISRNLISCQKPIPRTLSIAVTFPFIVVVDAADALVCPVCASLVVKKVPSQNYFDRSMFW